MSDKNLTEWLGVALEMETKGKAFYDRLEKAAANELGREIFHLLGTDEGVHIQRIEVIYDGLRSDRAWSRGWQALAPKRPDLTAIFRELAAVRGKQVTADTADIEALDLGIEFEGKSVTFYSRRLAEAVEEMEREFLAQMLAEEKGHHRALADMQFYLKDPAGYFREREKLHVDGG